MNTTEQAIFKQITEQYEACLQPVDTAEVWFGNYCITASYDIELGICEVSAVDFTENDAFAGKHKQCSVAPASEANLSKALRRYRGQCINASEYQEFLFAEAYHY